MEPRAKRIIELWNWLPAFRIVAEVEHVSLAADLLHVSPSSLSRTVRLLEENIGKPLFDRIGRQLRLNADGQNLLRSVRLAMRLIDDGVAEALAVRYSGPVEISSSAVFGGVFLIRTMQELTKAHPELEPRLSHHSTIEAMAMLLRGQLDIVFHHEHVASPDLNSVRLTSVTNRIFCGRSHALFERSEANLEEVLRHPFLVVGDRTSEGSKDSLNAKTSSEGWPTDLPRIIKMWVPDLQMACELCALGGLLVVLPEIVARPLVDQKKLWMLRSTPTFETTVFATLRPMNDTPGRAEAVLDAARHAVAGVVSSSGSDSGSDSGAELA